MPDVTPTSDACPKCGNSDQIRGDLYGCGSRAHLHSCPTPVPFQQSHDCLTRELEQRLAAAAALLNEMPNLLEWTALNHMSLDLPNGLTVSPATNYETFRNEWKDQHGKRHKTIRAALTQKGTTP